MSKKPLPLKREEIPRWLYAPYTKQRAIAELIILEGIEDVQTLCQRLGVARQTVWNTRSAIRRVEAEMATSRQATPQGGRGAQGGFRGSHVVEGGGVGYSVSHRTGTDERPTPHTSPVPFTSYPPQVTGHTTATRAPIQLPGGTFPPVTWIPISAYGGEKLLIPVKTEDYLAYLRGELNQKDLIAEWHSLLMRDEDDKRTITLSERSFELYEAFNQETDRYSSINKFVEECIEYTMIKYCESHPKE